jgi:Conserved TM helix
MTTTINSVGDTLMQLLNQVLLYVPKVISALIILIIGYIIARIVRGLVTKGLRLVHFDQVTDRAGITAMLQRAGSKMDGARLLGTIAFWWIFLMFIVNALDALALPTITAYLTLLLGFIPKLFVAFLIVVVGALIANVVAGAIRGATVETGTTMSGLLGALARWFILLFAVLAAVTQLGIAQSMIFILFASALGMVALAGGLAFGLGGRETAAQMVNNWYIKNQQGAAQLTQPAGQRQAQIPGGYRTPQTARYTTTDVADQDMTRQS